MITSLGTLFKPFISVADPENTPLLLVKVPCWSYKHLISRQNTHLTILKMFYRLTFYSLFRLFFKNSDNLIQKAVFGFPFTPSFNVEIYAYTEQMDGHVWRTLRVQFLWFSRILQHWIYGEKRQKNCRCFTGFWIHLWKWCEFALRCSCTVWENSTSLHSTTWHFLWQLHYA